MSHFQVTYENEKGWRWVARISNTGWNGVKDVAKKAIKDYPEHKPHGPWNIKSIDVCL